MKKHLPRCLSMCKERNLPNVRPRNAQSPRGQPQRSPQKRDQKKLPNDSKPKLAERRNHRRQNHLARFLPGRIVPAQKRKDVKESLAAFGRDDHISIKHRDLSFYLRHWRDRLQTSLILRNMRPIQSAAVIGGPDGSSEALGSASVSATGPLA